MKNKPVSKSVEEAKEKLIRALWESPDTVSRRNQMAANIEALIIVVMEERLKKLEKRIRLLEGDEA